MANIGGKVYPSTAESRNRQRNRSTSGYTRSTIVSRQKKGNSGGRSLQGEWVPEVVSSSPGRGGSGAPKRNVDEEDLEKKRSPLISPRLCEDNYSPKDLHLQIEVDSSEYKHRTLSERSSKNLRKQRLVLPQPLDKFEEYHEEAEFGKEHKLCNMKLSVKELEINRLKGIVDDLQRQVKLYEDDLLSAESNLKEEQEKTMLLIHQKQEKEDELSEMRLKYMKLRKGIEEYKKIHERSAERERKLVEQQTELERMWKKMGKFKQINDALSEKNDDLEDRIRKLQSKLDQYSTMKAENAKVEHLQSELDAKTEEVNKLTRQQVRSEEQIRNLNNEISEIQKTKRHTVNESFQHLLTENASLKSTLDLRNLESEKNVSILSKDIKDIQGSKRQAADERVQSLQTENASIKLELAKATTEIDAFRNKCRDLQIYIIDKEHTIHSLLNAVKEKETKFEALNTQLARKNNELSKDKENAENQKNRLSKALEENKKEIETMQNDIARYEEKISTLTKTVEDIKGSENQAADENIKGLQKKIGSLESELRNATTEMNDLSYKYKCLQTDKESAEYTINKLSRNVQEKEMEISSLIEDLAKSNENVDREEHTASADSIQKLNEENASLKSKLSQLSHETEKKVSALTKEIKSLQKSKGTSKEEYNARKLYEENEFLKVQLDRTSRSYDQKGRDSNEVKTERDHSLKRCNLGPEGNVKKDPKPTGLL